MINLGQDVHINFLSDMYSIAAPLKQNGDNTGMGMTQLPVGINGTVSNVNCGRLYID